MRILILVIFDHIYPGLSILHISTFLHWFLHFLPSFWVNFPEILRWKDLGGGTASSGAAGGGGAGGASASDFAVMDLGTAVPIVGLAWRLAYHYEWNDQTKMINLL